MIIGKLIQLESLYTSSSLDSRPFVPRVIDIVFEEHPVFQHVRPYTQRSVPYRVACKVMPSVLDDQTQVVVPRKVDCTLYVQNRSRFDHVRWISA
jgi:hypothetical protein